MELQSFLSTVPVGSENGVNIKCLAARNNVSTRKARAIIEQINKSGMAIVVNLSDNKGYFLAGEDEKYLERLYKAQETKRFNSLKDKLEGMNIYLDSEKQKEKEDKNQITIFDLGIIE